MDFRFKIICFLGLYFFYFSSFAQDNTATLLNETGKYIDQADELVDQTWKLAKKALVEKNMKETKQLCISIQKLAEIAESKANLAEKKADETEKAYGVGNCDMAANKADDAEDFCRHLGYFTHEILIYSRKAFEEKNESFCRSYLTKVINYAEESYESIKNARFSLEEVSKEAQNCKE